MKSVTKININTLNNGDNFISIPLGNPFSTFDMSEISQDEFIQDALVDAVNETEDFEKARFVPSSGITEIIVRLKENGGLDTTYEDLGYTDGDLNFLRNRFKNSFLSFNFYDSPFQTNQRLLFRIILFNQINDENRDVDKSLLPVGNSPVVYKLVNPRVKSGISEGFFIYYLKNPRENYPTNVYMYPTFNNAVDGISTPLLSYDSPLAANQLNQFNYIKYTLAKSNALYYYFIDSIDREIFTSGDTLTINLYKNNII